MKNLLPKIKTRSQYRFPTLIITDNQKVDIGLSQYGKL